MKTYLHKLKDICIFIKSERGTTQRNYWLGFSSRDDSIEKRINRKQYLQLYRGYPKL
jgi:hypothetical protein